MKMRGRGQNFLNRTIFFNVVILISRQSFSFSIFLLFLSIFLSVYISLTNRVYLYKKLLNHQIPYKYINRQSIIDGPKEIVDRRGAHCKHRAWSEIYTKFRLIASVLSEAVPARGWASGGHFETLLAMFHAI